ncbi:acylneuraminate cytidylyltransferase family protein [Qipengyuania sp. DY56-A-20]|uniref:Acylneuraminate cytidylyltransferase family protein n=1 Tax=Qipengyuania benthica TaxID=3067651 RepID=A0ABT9HBF2_9SPHN|nr:acylneuraminate cytidylyltransferase family protein [Qipengyuania sp. DY56-A-20]MDP4540581.1 acylneuraminate cytidylyltransferase family protein [Qipengyuania sp. DY56-A-20]
MTTVCTICARGGSQGLPGKNIRPLLGKPLITHTIGHALAHPEIDSVHVSTDSEEIAEIARKAGADVPFLRPAELSTADAGKLPAIEHLVRYLEAQGRTVTRIVDLQPTSPLRTKGDISGCLNKLDSQTDCATTATLSDANPYYSLVELDENGLAGLSKKGNFVARQQAPEVFRLTGSVYCWHRNSLFKGVLGGRTRLHFVPAERAVDIDRAIDFAFAELLLENNCDEPQKR